MQVPLHHFWEKWNWTVELITRPEYRPQAQGMVMYVQETVRLLEIDYFKQFLERTYIYRDALCIHKSGVKCYNNICSRRRHSEIGNIRKLK